MKTWALLIWFALGVHSVARAQTCHFGALSAAQEAQAEVTYERLLNDLGGALTPQDLLAMAESKTPFVLPRVDEKLDGLQKHLREFEKLLAQAEAITPELTEKLIRIVQKRAGATEAQLARQKTAVLQAQDVRVPGFVGHGNSDQRFLQFTGGVIRHSRMRGGSEWWNYYDEKSRAVAHVKIPAEQRFGSVATPTSDGKYLVTVSEENLYVHPITNGVPSQMQVAFGNYPPPPKKPGLLKGLLDRVRRVPDPPPKPKPSQFTADPVSAQHLWVENRLFGVHRFHSLSRYDVTTNVLTPLNTSAVETHGEIYAWTTVDGTGDLVFTTRRGATETVVRARLGADHNFETYGDAISHDIPPKARGLNLARFKPVANARAMIGYDSSDSVVLVQHGGTAYQARRLPLNSSEHIQDLKLRPDGTEAILLTGQYPQAFLRRYDLTGGTLGEAHPLGEKYGRAYLSPDGSRLYLGHRDVLTIQSVDAHYPH